MKGATILEFMEAIKIDTGSGEAQFISDQDVVICFNFRTDRPRQITEVLTQSDNADYGMKKLDLSYVTMTNYNASYKGCK